MSIHVGFSVIFPSIFVVAAEFLPKYNILQSGETSSTGPFNWVPDWGHSLMVEPVFRIC